MVDFDGNSLHYYETNYFGTLKWDLKRGYHESVTNLMYAAVILTTVHREGSFALVSERFETSTLVMSRIWQEGRGVTTYQKVADVVVKTPL